MWDNFWYAGHYPVAYSVLYYPLAALVGNVTLVLVAAVGSAALFASICRASWGATARWPSLAFGPLAAAPLFTGLYSYSLGLAALLGAVRALQARRGWLVLGFAALTLGFSPLAFAFLCVVLLAILITRRSINWRAGAIGLGIGALALVEAVLLTLFPSTGEYPFSVWDLLAALAVSAIGVGLARQSPRGAFIASLFLVWAAVCVVSYLVPSPIGDNITRLRALVFPVMLLTALLARFRPRPLAVVAVAAAFLYNLVPYLMQVPYRTDGRSSRGSFWAPAISFLKTHSGPEYRVEVVPTASHWEAYWLPKAGIALARGWYRQLDVVDNGVLYLENLTGSAYRAWLRSIGVKYVVRPRTTVDPAGAEREAAALDSGRLGLVPVFSTSDAVVYELPGAIPILTGPAPSRITAFDHGRIEGWTTAPGRYRLRVRYTRYWTVNAGYLCLRPGFGDMTTLVVERPGRFALQITSSPEAILDAAFASNRERCGPASTMR